MSFKDIVIDVRNISKCYEIYRTPRDRLKQLILPSLHKILEPISRTVGITNNGSQAYFRKFWALKNISLTVRRGESVGIIGRNGSGKSTLLQIIAGTLTPTIGDVSRSGRLAALLELGSGFNPEFTGRDNVFLNGYLLGLNKQEIIKRFEHIIEFADIGDFIDQPVKTYSSGMFVRLAFAVQAHVNASIMIIDEALAVGDVFFRQKCYKRLEELRQSGTAILLVSHAMTDIEQYCERALLLEQGNMQFIGNSVEATKHYYLMHQIDQKSSITPLAADVVQSSNTNRYSQSINPIPSLGNSSANSGFPKAIQCPSKAALLDLSTKPQVSVDYVRCTSVALCNAMGEACHHFHQGERAIFYYEFELHRAIEVPICGIVISNDRGIIVHGKNSCQYDGHAPLILSNRSKIYCKQEIVLDLGLGEYTFEVGLVAISYDDWKIHDKLSYEEASAKHIRICHVPNVAFFSVGLAKRNGVSVLTHHGLANLAGNISIDVESLEEQKVEICSEFL